MRYTRLRRQIEGGTLVGAHGTPFSGVAEKTVLDMRKRKTGSQLETGSASQPTALKKSLTPHRKIKSEQDEFSDGYETDYSQDSDSEDEIPLAKRRHVAVKSSGVSFEEHSIAPTSQRMSSGLHSRQHNACLGPSLLEARHVQQDIGHIQSTIPSEQSRTQRDMDTS